MVRLNKERQSRVRPYVTRVSVERNGCNNIVWIR